MNKFGTIKNGSVGSVLLEVKCECCETDYSTVIFFLMYFGGVENRLHLIKTANKLGLSLFFNITKMYDSRNDVENFTHNQIHL